MKNNCSVIILAAGNSSRMGKPKFLLQMPSGETFLETITRQYSDFGCTNIVVVLNGYGNKLITNQPQNIAAHTQFTINYKHNSGRFSSIKTGVKLIETNYTFIHNIDNPYAKKDVLEQIYNKKLQAEVIKPTMNNRGGHPVLISKRVCKDILIQKENDLNFSSFLKRYSTKEVDVDDDSIFKNINTNEELMEFIKR
jgi:molybdenum cofactor cytidylyltransferase